MRDLSRIREDGHYWLTRAQLMALGVTTLSLAALAFFVGLMVGQRQAAEAAVVATSSGGLVDPDVEQDGLTDLLIRVEQASTEARVNKLSFPEQLRDPEPSDATAKRARVPEPALESPPDAPAPLPNPEVDQEDGPPGEEPAEISEETIVDLQVALADVIVTPDERAIPEPPPEPPPEAAPPQRKGYAIQVAAFDSAEAADVKISELQAAGHSAYRIEALIQGNTWYRVRIGPYPSQSAAAVARGELSRALGQNDLMITEVR